MHNSTIVEGGRSSGQKKNAQKNHPAAAGGNAGVAGNDLLPAHRITGDGGGPSSVSSADSFPQGKPDGGRETRDGGPSSGASRHLSRCGSGRRGSDVPPARHSPPRPCFAAPGEGRETEREGPGAVKAPGPSSSPRSDHPGSFPAPASPAHRGQNGGGCGPAPPGRSPAG